MTKSKLLRPDSFGAEGSLAACNQFNGMLEDLARNSGWMELALVGGFTSGDEVLPGTPVRLQELAQNNVPFETGRDDPIAVVTRCLQGSRSEFFGLVIDQFQAGHFTLARVLTWGRFQMNHAYSHGSLVYLNDSGLNGLSDTPFTGGEVPIGEWLAGASGFKGIHLKPSIVL